METNFNYVFKYFETEVGSYRDQRVDGSVVPIDFVVDVNIKSWVRRIDFVSATDNMISLLDYGLIKQGLQNGVQLLTELMGVETEIFNVQSYIEYGHFADGQLGQYKLIENPTENILIASVTLDPIMPVEPGTRFITRIRDDLSMLRYHQTSIVLLEPYL